MSEKTPCGSILVSHHLLEVTTDSSYFGWSLTGGTTVVLNNKVKKMVVGR